ncbi:MAG: hypothetical protein ABI640_15595 [Gammaproteobacteria bacterium]
MRVALTAVALASFAPAEAETPPMDGDLAARISPLLEQYSRDGDFDLPGVSTADLAALAAGDTVFDAFREPSARAAGQVEVMGLVGWRIVAAPRLLVWLSILGGSEESSARLHHAVLVQRADGAYVSYHHMALPWPFKDRQWTLLCDKNLSLAEHSHDAIWEHRWDLLPRDEALLKRAYEEELVPGLTQEVVDESVYLRANRGAWILFDLGPSGTLVAATMDMDFGGHLPAALVRSTAKHQLKTFLESLSALRGTHYNGTPLVHDGRGLPITREAAAALGAQPAQARLTGASAGAAP